jgi:hypothetical protein
MGEYALGYREWSAIVFGHAVDIAAQNPVSQSAGTEE